MNDSQPTQHAKMTATVTLHPAQKANGAETRTAPSPGRKDPTEVKSPEADTHQGQSETTNMKGAEATPTSESKTNDNKTIDSTANQETKKRTRKTIEQELAELDAKRERLMDKKRRQEAHEKIVFGTTIIAMLVDP